MEKKHKFVEFYYESWYYNIHDVLSLIKKYKVRVHKSDQLNNWNF